MLIPLTHDKISEEEKKEDKDKDRKTILKTMLTNFAYI